MEQAAEWAYRIVMLILVGGGLYFMRERLKTMKTTVDNQQTLLETMDTVLKSTDERNMLARLEAHKKFVEHEKEAAEKRLVANFSEEKRKFTQFTQDALESVLKRFTKNVVAFATNALPYVPRNRRGEFINSLDLTHLPELKTWLDEIASSAPDLSVGGSGGFGVSPFGGAQAQPGRSTGPQGSFGGAQTQPGRSTGPQGPGAPRD